MAYWKYFWINSVTLILFLSDITLKQIFLAAPGREYFVFDWLKLKLTTNTGVAFGWLSSSFQLLSQTWLLFFYCFIFLCLAYWLFKEYQRHNTVLISALTLIILGAFSNGLDRLRLGAVVDYLDLKYYTVFNLADVMIVFGCLLILFSSFFKKTPSLPKK